MYLLETCSFIYNFLVHSGVWFLSWILVPRVRTCLLRLQMSWALCLNEPVHSWLVFVIYPYIAPDIVHTTLSLHPQRWRCLPQVLQLLCQLCWCVACWLQEPLNPWWPLWVLLGSLLLVAVATDLSESDCYLHCHDQFCLAVEFLMYY